MDVKNILIAIAVVAGGISSGIYDGSLEVISTGIVAFSGLALFFKELFKK